MSALLLLVADTHGGYMVAAETDDRSWHWQVSRTTHADYS